MKTRLNWLIPLLILTLIAGAARMYRLQRPLADWHSWRQADTVSVTREYYKNGVDLLRPQYHDLSNIPSGEANPDGWRMVEFPLVNAAQAWTYPLVANQIQLHIYARLWSIGFSLLAGWALFGLARRLVNTRTAFIATAVFWLLPFNLYYHTTTLPEIGLLFFSLTAVYLWVIYLDSNQQKYAGLSIALFSLSLLIKPMIVMLAPALVWISIRRQGWQFFKHKLHYLYLILVFAPLIAWRIWIQQFPEGIPASAWLFNGTDIRWSGAFFHWIFAERIGKLILGFYGLIPLAIGVWHRPSKRQSWTLHWWLVGVLAYLVVFATGNVTHDYYQIIIVPVLALFVGIGFDQLLRQKQDQTRWLGWLLALVSFSFMLAFAWYHVRDWFNINNPLIVEAGAAVNRLTPEDSLVIAPYGGDTAFLYQTNRRGFPIGFEIEDKIDQGADYYISTSYDDEARQLEQACDLVEQTPRYILIDLSQCQFETGEQQ